LDGDAIPVYERSKQGTYSFSGKRVTRGLYRTASGAFINADLNGAYNIMCKAVEGIMPPFGDHDKGTVVVPARRLKLSGFIPSRTVSV
jgi:transposase